MIVFTLYKTNKKNVHIAINLALKSELCSIYSIFFLAKSIINNH